MNRNDPISKLKGIGPKSAEAYQKLHIKTVGELLDYLPKRYEKYESERPVASAAEGRLMTFLGTFVGNPTMIRTNRGTMLSCRFQDTSGKISVKWFNQPYIRKQIAIARFIFLRGRVSKVRGELCLLQPEMYTPEAYREKMKTLHPVYGLTSGVTTNAIAKAVRTALDNCEIEERLPAGIVRENRLMRLREAYEEVHFPKSEEVTQDAIRRFAFDEFFAFLLSVRCLREKTEQLPNRFPMRSDGIADRLTASLPYELTGAQRRTWAEIFADLGGNRPMQRLLQGDVGSGKTIIAELAMAASAEAGCQSALMVPTEVLAKQHYNELTKRLTPFGIRVGMLVGSMTAAEKRNIRNELASGEIHVLVGTHALFQQAVEFAKLGLIIIDEQHRFGVEQRRKLIDKGDVPHVLLMSATPIPRTLAMMMYADLDVSILDEMPSNRQRIRTAVVDTSYRPRAFRFLAEHVAAGEQAYVICPLIEESDGLDAENVADCAARLAEELPGTVRIDTLHGRMSAKEKTDVMQRFAAHETDILVSTTVVEVGVDVANATVILIEDAERFGLAALHQLRGRVGRGEKQSYCILMQGNDSADAKERLSVLLTATDGFAIAEKDLTMRGPGDFFGIRQSGEEIFRIADPIRDAEVLTLAKHAVSSLTEREYERACKLCLAEGQSDVVY
ncbi:MAG: ATP-dependent DNA helicase RecG [Lachnospiraceae bacterium]|nr:ATP-dependent DNA helicase RecG [Lachnospiraceae bacterium]